MGRRAVGMDGDYSAARTLDLTDGLGLSPRRGLGKLIACRRFIGGRKDAGLFGIKNGSHDLISSEFNPRQDRGDKRTHSANLT